MFQRKNILFARIAIFSVILFVMHPPETLPLHRDCGHDFGKLTFRGEMSKRLGYSLDLT